MLWDWRLEKKWSVVGFCSGAVAGLVAITPASGYVGPPAAVLFGFMAGTLCNFATQLKFLLGYDDTLDVSISRISSNFWGFVFWCQGKSRSLEAPLLMFQMMRPKHRMILTVASPSSSADLRLPRNRRCRRKPAHRPLRTSLHRRSRRDIHPGRVARPPLQATRVPSRRLRLRAGVLLRHDHPHPLGHALHPRSPAPRV